MVARLREFEGWRCLWRLPVAALLYVSVPVTFVGATVLAAYIARGKFDVETAVVAALVGAVGTSLLGPRLARRRLHRKIVANRLWTFEEPNPSTEISILLQQPDLDAARAALRRARFAPHVYYFTVPTPPPDAPELSCRFAVHEPEAWRQSSSYEDRTRRIVTVLEGAGIRARVGGLDALPGSPPGKRSVA